MPEERLPFTQRNLPPFRTDYKPRKRGPRQPVDINPEFLKNNTDDRPARRREARGRS